MGRFNTYNYVGNGQGTSFRITVFSSRQARFTYWTESLDYAIVLSGTLDMELDEGRTVVVQRGTTHAWLNTDDTPAGPAFFLIDTQTVISGDTVPRTLHPDPA